MELTSSLPGEPMRLRILIEPQQGATYFDVLRLAQEAEALGFDGVFCSDHYLHMGDGSGAPGPCDAWTTIAGLARETHRIRIGTLMTPTTFRRPGPLAIAVAQIDAMSGGRVELGLGTGWYEAEHRAYGIPFPSVATRFEHLEEQLAIVHGLWEAPAGELFSFRGKHYEIVDSPGLPKPAQQPHPPILIGGAGPTVTPRLAAKFADEYNVPVRQPEVTRAQFERVALACEHIGRDPASIVFSAAQALCVGESVSDAKRRAERIGRDLDELRSAGLGGTVDEVAEKIRLFAGFGARRLYLQVLDIFDLDHLRLVAEQLAPLVTERAGH
ncbi:MAG: Luciferase-like monooxygenase [Acidimicrobiaceae bacterium]|nr:Luciferase-like monooxygenase [Acidimicrobiaceae bacterium]